MTKTPEGIEVIEGDAVGEARRFTAEEKRRLVAEALEAGSSLSANRPHIVDHYLS
ncbi:MAG: hypothetical protein ACLQAT_27030 [Candidatus Binataceae bacterium]